MLQSFARVIAPPTRRNRRRCQFTIFARVPPIAAVLNLRRRVCFDYERNRSYISDEVGAGPRARRRTARAASLTADDDDMDISLTPLTLLRARALPPPIPRRP